MVNGERLYFEASGLYDGLVLLGDRASRSYWHHATGECLEGKYEGEQLQIANLFHYTFKRALEEYPNLKLAISKPPFYITMFLTLSERLLKRKKGFLPPFFRKTMQPTDTRLDEQTMGLGVTINGSAKFYPIDEIIRENIIEDVLEDQTLLITYDEVHQYPKCIAPKEDEIPLQLFTRWYGFSFTHKECDIYKGR